MLDYEDRGIAQWIKHLLATQVVGVRTLIQPKILSASILSGTPTTCTQSSLNPSRAICGSKHRYKSDVREKGVKRYRRKG